MENTGKIFGISLGPGDPELITLKALKALNAVDVIFCPGTKSGEGRMKSRALDILRQLEVDETKIRLFQVPMSRVILSCPTDDGSCVVLILLSGRSHITG